jgi:hypothetical protein
MNFLVKYLLDNGFNSADSAESLSSKLEWIHGLQSPFMSWFFERLESIQVLNDDGKICDWNGLTGKASPNELDRLEAEILLIKQEAQNIESKSHELKLAMYDTNQTNAALQAEILQKREKTNFKDHNMAAISDKVKMIFNALDRSIYTLHCRTH